ncbi:MAG: Hpt domain-containing protein [Polyangiaceae bacterium]
MTTPTPNPGQPAPSAPLLDLSPLHEVTGGATDILHEILREYVTTSRDLLRDIRAALAASDAKALRQAAHSLKGSSATIGAQRLRAECEIIEHAALAGRIADAQAHHLQLEQTFSATMSLLDRAVQDQA